MAEWMRRETIEAPLWPQLTELLMVVQVPTPPSCLPTASLQLFLVSISFYRHTLSPSSPVCPYRLAGPPLCRRRAALHCAARE